MEHEQKRFIKDFSKESYTGPSRAPIAPEPKIENGTPFQTKKFLNLKFCECSNYQFLTQHICRNYVNKTGA